MRLIPVLHASMLSVLLLFPMASCTQSTADAPSIPAAQQKSAAPTAPSVAGGWTWAIDAGGNAITHSVTLAQAGEALTGKFTDGFDDTIVDIKDGKIHDGHVTFTVVRPFMDAGNITLKFDGKFDGKIITGKVEWTVAEQTNTGDWNAKRTGA